MAASRGDTADYAHLFLGGVALLDTRAPLEFTRGAFPQAHNLPLMTDDERAAVGTCYKERGQAAAIELGHSLVSGTLREGRTERWADFAKAHPDGYLYCFRGGLRSQIAQQWLCDAGVDYPRVSGGYKAMRQFLLTTLEAQSQAAEFMLVAGATGSGKTRAIETIHRVVDRAIDLEGLARHRGSAFGHLLVEQPTQIDFENALGVEMLKRAQLPGPVFLEDEGRLIGRVALPETLCKRMEPASLLVIDEPLAARVQVLLEDYVFDLGERYRERHGEAGPRLHRERLHSDLLRIRKRLGGERQQRVAALLDRAFDEQEAGGGSDAHRAWIAILLGEYYDPMYEYQMSRRTGQRLLVASRDAVVEFACEQVRRA